MLRILIFGGSGFVGRNLFDSLTSFGHSVETVGFSKKNMYPVDLVQNNICLINEYDIIIHCASVVHNQDHISGFHANLILNDYDITLNVYNSIKKLKFKKLIYLSSVNVYGLDAGYQIDTLQELRINNGYALSKVLSEKFLTTSINPNKLIILRLPLVNGPNPKGNILKAKKAIKANKLMLFKGNTSEKSILEVEDLASFIHKNGLNVKGIHQIKSYDIEFNLFIKGLSSKRIVELPLVILYILERVTRLFGMKKLNLTLRKIANTLTFKQTI